MQKRYWLRGGASFVVCFLILQFVSLITESHSDVALIYFLTNGPVIGSLSAFPFTLEQKNIFLALRNPLVVIALSTVLYFLVGIFFGWLYGKIKNRNKMVS